MSETNKFTIACEAYAAQAVSTINFENALRQAFLAGVEFGIKQTQEIYRSSVRGAAE